MYDNEEQIDPVILPTAQYQLRRVPQRLQHHERVATLRKKAPLQCKHVVKAKQPVPPLPIRKTTLPKTPSPKNRAVKRSPSTSPFSVVVEISEPSSSPSRNSDTEINTNQCSP